MDPGIPLPGGFRTSRSLPTEWTYPRGAWWQRRFALFPSPAGRGLGRGCSRLCRSCFCRLFFCKGIWPLILHPSTSHFSLATPHFSRHHATYRNSCQHISIDVFCAARKSLRGKGLERLTFVCETNGRFFVRHLSHDVNPCAATTWRFLGADGLGGCFCSQPKKPSRRRIVTPRVERPGFPVLIRGKSARAFASSAIEL